MYILVPWKPIVVVWGLLSAMILFGFVASSVLQGKDPFAPVSDPEIQKKIFGPRWQHEVDKQAWPLWKRLIHRLQGCTICKPKTGNRECNGR